MNPEAFDSFSLISFLMLLLDQQPFPRSGPFFNFMFTPQCISCRLELLRIKQFDRTPSPGIPGAFSGVVKIYSGFHIPGGPGV
jgi:hypothetical protein